MSSSGPDMTSGSQGLCANCKTPTTKTCDLCSSAPAYGSTQSSPKLTFYCSPACQSADRRLHKASCSTLEARKRLDRASKLLKVAMIQIRMFAYPIFASSASVTRSQSSMSVVMKSHVPSDTEKKRPLQHFKVAIGCEDEMKKTVTEALLLYQACTEALMYLLHLAETFVDGSAKLNECAVVLKETPLRISVALPNGALATPKVHCHEILTVRLQNGESWVIDVTGIQYGFTKILIPWEQYLREHVAQVAGVFDPGHCMNRGLRSLLQVPVREVLAPVVLKHRFRRMLDFQFGLWKKENGNDMGLKNLVEGNDKEFCMKLELFDKKVEKFMKDIITKIYSPDEAKMREEEIDKRLEENQKVEGAELAMDALKKVMRGMVSIEKETVTADAGGAAEKPGQGN